MLILPQPGWLARSPGWLLVALVGLASTTAVAARLKAGDAAPDYVGTTIDDQRTLLSDYRGKVIVVSFWASWCGPCLKEMPILEGIQKSAGKDQMQVIAVNTESIETYRRIVQRLSSLQLLLTHDHDRVGADSYGVQGIPHMIIVDRAGRIARINHGYDASALDGIVDDINRALLAN